MIIIGLSGRKQTGKDSVVNALRQLQPSKLIVRVAFADAIKQEVAIATNKSLAFIEEHKENFRLILQGWGTDFRRNLCNKEYWTEQWLKRCLKEERAAFIVCPDVRFKNEAETIRKVDGKLFRVRRRSLAEEDNHASETELTDSNFGYDDWIDNDGSLEDLTKNVNKTFRRFGLL